MPRRLLRTVILTVMLVLALPMRAGAEESCVNCHPNVKTELADSVHAGELGCASCHGGDPTIVGMESHAAAKGYVGKPRRADIPRLCASCHADPARMRPFGLATDQYAQYQTSRHGLLLAQGDDRVAVCSDCHGAHRIVARREPTSPVSPRNIPATCGRCHSDAQLMAPYGIATDQQEKFRDSVHGRALFIEEHPGAPTCATCHGAHGATPPQVGAIAKVCGHCHARIRGYLEEGPHRKAAEEGGLSECVSCHGYHDTREPDDELFVTACSGCHAEGTPGAVAAEKLRTLLRQTRDDLTTAREEISRVAETSPTVVRFRPRLQQGWAYLMEALPVQHALNVNRVADLTRGARSIADEVRGAAHEAEQDGRLRYLVLALVWVFILLLVGVTVLYRRERRRARAAGEGR